MGYSGGYIKVKMTKLKCWKKVNTSTKREFEQEGDRVHSAWINNGNVVFVIDSPKGFKVGSKSLSQMDYPKSLKNTKTKPQALSFANKYMKSHDKC
jgi:hypothetical protein